MRKTRLYVDARLATGETISVAGEPARYLGKVLRLEAGARIVLFNGNGGEYEATIIRMQSGRAEISLGEFAEPARESPLRITLAQGLSRGVRMDFMIQKAVELGVAAVAPIATARSVVRLDGPRLERRRLHWRGVAISACQQCGRTRLPEILPPQSLRELLESDTGGARLVLSPTATATIDAAKAIESRVTLLVGPEGGLEDAELAAAVGAGYRPTRLGPRVLRTETAALAAISALQCLEGDFSSRGDFRD
ncbi:MAG TPA: 16S rRNA (uracil(1498)-N(3))-methyltransferase [Gammaproteobacteria bacterium]